MKDTIRLSLFAIAVLIFTVSCKNRNVNNNSAESDLHSVPIRNTEARDDSVQMAYALSAQSQFQDRLYAVVETDPVQSMLGEDAADDPAIWVNEANPANSLVLGTNKTGGIYVYNLDGELLQVRNVGRVNNIDLRDGFVLNHEEVVLVAASNRTNNCITILTIDRANGELSDSLLNIKSSVDEVYGLCCYYDPANNDHFVFVNGTGGKVEQWIIEGENGFSSKLVRTFNVASQPEGMVADDEEGIVYIGVEQTGIYSLSANPEVPAELQLLSGSDSLNNAIDFDIEGIALFSVNNKKFLLASIQGNFSYAIFDIGESSQYKKSFIIIDNQIDGVEETDGLDITTSSLPGFFDEGLLVVQDGFNTNEDTLSYQNFKYISFSDIRSLLEL